MHAQSIPLSASIDLGVSSFLTLSAFPHSESI